MQDSQQHPPNADARARRRRLLGGVALLGASLAVSVGLAEIVASRLASRPAPPYPKSAFANPFLVYNSLRFRDFEYPVEKPPDVFRIVGLGDSFTTGVATNFDDVWTKRLERYLNIYTNVRGKRYQVLSMGRPGSSTPHQTAMVRDIALRHAPDLIVIGYCLNDAEDQDDRQGVVALRERLFTRYKDRMRGSGARAFLFDRSALVRLVVGRIGNTLWNRGHIGYYEALYREDYPGWKKTQGAMLELARISRESGVPIVVMIFPLFSWDLDESYPHHAIHQKLHRALDAAGVPYLDLLPKFKGLEHRVLEAIPWKDPHPSDVAHRIAAEQLFRYLQARKLLPRGEPIAENMRARRLPPPWQ